MSPTGPAPVGPHCQTEPVTIDLSESPPPIGPLRRRAQRLLAVAATVIVAAAVVVAVRVGASRPAAIAFDGRLGWLEALALAPPRGSLAADLTFIADLTDRVTALVRSAEDTHPDLVAANGRRDPRQEVALLYGEDIAGRRVILLALRIPLPAVPPSGDDPLRRMPGRTTFVWLSGPRGATAGYLATAFTRSPLPDLRTGTLLPQPLLVAVVGEDVVERDSVGCIADPNCLMIALAPPQCSVATAPASAPTDFRTEPTGSYLVRTAQTYRLERWRVTCDGVVREERGMPPMWQPGFFGRETITGALAEARGPLPELYRDERQAAATIDLLQRINGSRLAGPPRVVWAGPAIGVDPDHAGLGPDAAADVTAMIAVGRSIDSRWLAGYTVAAERSGGLVIASATFPVTADPTPPHGMLAIVDPFSDDEQILVVGPTTATSVRLVGPGGRVSTAPVVDDRAVLTPVPPIPAERLAGVRVEAVDATGAVVATGPVTTAVPDTVVSRWDEPMLCCA